MWLPIHGKELHDVNWQISHFQNKIWSRHSLIKNNPFSFKRAYSNLNSFLYQLFLTTPQSNAGLSFVTPLSFLHMVLFCFQADSYLIFYHFLSNDKMKDCTFQGVIPLASYLSYFLSQYMCESIEKSSRIDKSDWTPDLNRFCNKASQSYF